MSGKIRAAIIGFAHMHVNEIAQYISEHPDFELVGGADIPSSIPEMTVARYTRVWNRDFVNKTYAVPIYDDYLTMLESTRPDIAFILCENSRKAEIAMECARRGIAVSIEKPMAMDLQDALKIRECCNQYSVEAMVNWPIAWRGWLHEMKAILDSGIVGKLIKIHAPAGHTGPLGVGAKHRGVNDRAQDMTDEQRERTWWYRKSDGGGVFLDMMCYGCMYSCMYTGERADSVIASCGNFNTQYADIEDNAVALFRYPAMIAVADATWTTPSAAMPPGPTLYCTNGVISCRRQSDGSVRAEAVNLLGEPVQLPAFQFPESMTNIAWHYAAHKKTGMPIHEMLTLERNVEIMAMIDAAIRSCQSGRWEPI